MNFMEGGDPAQEAIREEIKGYFDDPDIRYAGATIEDLPGRLDAISASMSADRARGIPTEDANRQLKELLELIDSEIDSMEKGSTAQKLAIVKKHVEMARIYWYGSKPNGCKDNLEAADWTVRDYFTDKNRVFDVQYGQLLGKIQSILRRVETLYPDED